MVREWTDASANATARQNRRNDVRETTEKRIRDGAWMDTIMSNTGSKLHGHDDGMPPHMNVHAGLADLHALI